MAKQLDTLLETSPAGRDSISTELRALTGQGFHGLPRDRNLYPFVSFIQDGQFWNPMTAHKRWLLTHFGAHGRHPRTDLDYEPETVTSEVSYLVSMDSP